MWQNMDDLSRVLARSSRHNNNLVYSLLWLIEHDRSTLHVLMFSILFVSQTICHTAPEWQVEQILQSCSWWDDELLYYLSNCLFRSHCWSIWFTCLTYLWEPACIPGFFLQFHLPLVTNQHSFWNIWLAPLVLLNLVLESSPPFL